MKIVKFLPMSLLVAVGIAQAKSQCFHPYNLKVVNKSGGVATLLRVKDVAGIARKAKINNGSSKLLQVNDLGAHLSFEVGPEEQKEKLSVSLFDVTGANPHITLEPKMIKAVDVNTMHGKTYRVTFKNESGGIATISGCSEKELKIADGESKPVSIHAGAVMSVVSGPEGNKSHHVIQFFEKTSQLSSITLKGGGILSDAINAKGVNIKVKNGLFGRLSRGLAPMKKMERGARTPMAPVAAPMKKDAYKKDVATKRHAMKKSAHKKCTGMKPCAMKKNANAPQKVA